MADCACTADSANNWHEDRCEECLARDWEEWAHAVGSESLRRVLVDRAELRKLIGAYDAQHRSVQEDQPFQGLRKAVDG